MPFFAGLDWGGTAHAVCAIDATGAVRARIEVQHDAAGLADLLARLKRIAPPADLPVAIERPSGLIVDALIEAGHPVVPIHPNIVKACRPRYRAAGGKSDPADAKLLAVAAAGRSAASYTTGGDTTPGCGVVPSRAPSCGGGSPAASKHFENTARRSWWSVHVQADQRAAGVPQ